jgi:hypothetical protein
MYAEEGKGGGQEAWQLLQLFNCINVTYGPGI